MEPLPPLPETMTPNLLLGLVLLLPAHLSALGCNSLKLEQQRLNSESLKMLQVAGRKFPEECLENMTSFNLPAKTLKGHRPEFATKAIGEMLQGYFSILSGDLVKSEWKPTIANRNSRQPMNEAKGWEDDGYERKRFLSMLHAQIERIQRCLAKKEATLGRSTTEWKTTLKLKKYFQRIRVFIKENGQSSCAWDILRLELQMGFTHIDILTQRMDI